MNKADLIRLKKLHAMLGSQHKGEAENARQRIIDLLKRYGKSWNDLPNFLAQGSDEPAPPPPPKTGMPHPLDLITRLFEKYVHSTDAQRIALALWTAHTFIYARFSITPRLAVTSPVRGCGKSTTFNLIEKIAFNARKMDHTTPAALFRIIDAERGCMLLDEADNWDLLLNRDMKSIINGGHASNGSINRTVDGASRLFTTFAPLALAAIGSLPLTILHRSIVIRMERAPRTAQFERFDPKTKPEQQRMCDAVHNATLEWAQGTQFDPDPPTPKELHWRAADNWRVCFAIADAAGEEWAKAARAAAIELSRGQDEDMPILLLRDIREILDRLTLDRIGSGRLIGELIDLPDGRWSEWPGIKGDSAPRKLTPSGLAQTLAQFGIRPGTIWPARRGVNEKSVKGYKREQFESAWAAYCDEGTPSGDRSKVVYLRGDPP